MNNASFTLPSKADLVTWVEALRSGRYTQTEIRLEDSKGFCALGVACDVFIPREARVFYEYNSSKVCMKGTLPTEQPAAPAWLKDFLYVFDQKLDVSILDLNDKGFNVRSNFSFDEIADLIEATFILEVLN